MGERSDGREGRNASGRERLPSLGGRLPDDGDEETVECFFSGKQLPRSQAVRVKVGSGVTVWAACDMFREG